MQFRLHIDVSKIVITVVLLILVGALSACKVLGTGRSTLVLADPLPCSDNGAPKYSGSEFKYLIAASKEKRLIGLQGKDPHTNEQWEAFKNKRLGGTDANVASIDINVRDQSNTPALELFNIQTANAPDIFKTLIDPKSNQDTKEKQLDKVRYNYRTMPEADLSFVSQGYVDKGNETYYYFPRITIDLTGTLNTAETLDRFDYIAVAIRIHGDTDTKFINFSPKAADLFEFTLGQLKQTASAKASANTSNKVTTGGAAGTDTSAGGEIGYGGSVDFTLTDELTRDLKSSLEARSVGIMQNGKLLLIELRSNEQKRISGTYTFNVMLQIPSEAKRGTSGPTKNEISEMKISKGRTLRASQSNDKCITAEAHVASEDKISTDAILTWTTSEPKEKSISAEVRLVGIVRRVEKPGTIGIFEQVPEPLNDVTFRQVVLYDKNVLLWKYPELPVGKLNPNLIVYSNIDEASFIVEDECNGKKLGYGTGREWYFSILPNDAKHKVKIRFLPAIVGGDKHVVLAAPDITGITLGRDVFAIGKYMPSSEPTPTSKSKSKSKSPSPYSP
jgi:hypothetical protein